jgi:hypothetical protein
MDDPSRFRYVGVAAVAHVPWGHALRSLVVPEIEWTPAYASGFVAILGTTISPYLFFWQAAQEVEEERRTHAKPLMVSPKRAGPELKRIRNDTLIGMAISTVVSVAIVFATARHSTRMARPTLNPRPRQPRHCGRSRNLRIRPVRHRRHRDRVAAVPVLAGSVAYAISEMFGLQPTLDAKVRRARVFTG